MFAITLSPDTAIRVLEFAGEAIVKKLGDNPMGHAAALMASLQLGKFVVQQGKLDAKSARQTITRVVQEKTGLSDEEALDFTIAAIRALTEEANEAVAHDPKTCPDCQVAAAEGEGV